jgi:hypothetical protein
MTPLEELRAAHERLSGLRDMSPPQLLHGFCDPGEGWFALTNGQGGELVVVDTRPLADLIVTLHRTIDAQLVLLAEAMDDHEGVFVGDCPYPQHALDLARSINGYP